MTILSRLALAACLIAAAGILGYLSLRRMTRRLLHWLACAWMQCDEVRE